MEEKFLFENFYESIKDVTFESEIVSLTTDDMKGLQQFYLNEVRKDNSRINEDGILEQDILQKLTKYVDQVIKDRNWNDGIFVKLSDRSPKDAYTQESLLESAKSFILSSSEAGSHSTNVRAMNALIRAQCQLLCAKNGAEALKLLTTSRRINQDIALAMKENIELKLVIRKYDKLLDPIWEFRGFVYQNELCACCQYHSICYLPEIIQHQAVIKEKIVNFFNNNVRDKLKYLENYVVDFAVYPSSICNNDNNIGDNNIWIVEINDPPPITGSSMFTYNNEEDALMMKTLPITFRVMEIDPPLWYLTQETSKSTGMLIKELSEYYQAAVDNRK